MAENRWVTGVITPFATGRGPTLWANYMTSLRLKSQAICEGSLLTIETTNLLRDRANEGEAEKYEPLKTSAKKNMM